jgi:hypothetical protein
MESHSLKWNFSIALFLACPPVTLAFEVLSGVTPEQARELVEKMNDHIVGVIVTPK